MQVIGTVESLTAELGAPVHGIIDWDLENSSSPHLHVLGAGLFYNIESAILNPLTLGLYLLHNFSSKLVLSDYGLDGLDLVALSTDDAYWQAIADGVMKRVLEEVVVNHDVECTFLTGWRVWFDRRYVHMKGQDLEKRVMGDADPFLKGLPKRPTLLMHVVQQGIGVCHGRTMPKAFADLFLEIQNSSS